jgi:hypothetical protein
MLREGEDLEIVAEHLGHGNIAVTQSVYGESYLRRASARGHRTATVVIDLPKPSLPANVGKQFFRDSDPVRSADDRIRPLPTCTFEISCCVFVIA